MRSPSQWATSFCLPWGTNFYQSVIVVNVTVSYLQFKLHLLRLENEHINVHLSLQLGLFCNYRNNFRFGCNLSLSSSALGTTQPPIQRVKKVSFTI